MIGIVPAQFTGKDREAAEAAIKAYQGMWTTFDNAARDPSGKDWETDLRRYAGGPAATTLLNTIAKYAEKGRRQVGVHWATAIVTSISGPDVYFDQCLDLAHIQMIDASGNSDFHPNPVRQLWSIGVEDFGPQGWLVYRLDIPAKAKSC